MSDDKREATPVGAAPTPAPEEQLRIILEHSPDIITLMSPEGTILYINRAMVLGTSTEYLIGKSAAMFVPEPDRGRWQEAMARAAQTGEVQRVDVTSVRDRWWQTRIVPISRSGRVESVLTIGTDLTSVMEAERRSRSAAEMLRIAVETSGVGTWRWIVAEDRIIWDDGMLEIYGRRELGPPRDFAEYAAMVHEEDRERVLAAGAAGAGEGTLTSLEQRIVRPDGSMRWVLARGGHVVKDEQGRVSEIIGAVVDITEDKLMDERVRHGQKMEAVGQLAAGIAHDFNNLVLVIQGNASLAIGEQSAAERSLALREILDASEKAAELIRELLAFGRKRPVEASALDPNELVSDLLRLIHRLMPANIETSFHPGLSTDWVWAARSQLEQVVMNVALNARDAMPDGGRCTFALDTLEVGFDEQGGGIGNVDPTPGTYVRLTVVDTGGGMSREVLSRAFEPFFTTKPPGLGTGLGLSTAYGVVRQHGGFLRILSEPGRGTKVEIHLPRVSSGTIPTPSVVAEAAAGTETILIAEDEDLVRRVVARILESAGYTVIEATDGVQAVEKFAQHRRTIDLVILDVMMPRMTGLEARDQISAIQPDVPIVFSSGYNDTWAERLASSQATLLHKPYEPDALLRLVRSVLDAKG